MNGLFSAASNGGENVPWFVAVSSSSVFVGDTAPLPRPAPFSIDPDNMEAISLSGDKRRISTVSEYEDSSLPSEDSTMMEEEDAAADQVPKRMRYTENASVSPAVQRIIDHSSSSATVQNSGTKQQQKQPAAAAVEWWKQQRKKPAVANIHNSDASICHVCHNSYPDMRVAVPAPAVKNNQTLHAFFAPKKEVQRYSSFVPSTTTTTMQQQQRGIRCTFCERSDICAKCLQNCEACLMVFCSFCSTTDNHLRQVCLDCCATANEQQQKTSNNDDDDGMQIE